MGLRPEIVHCKIDGVVYKYYDVQHQQEAVDNLEVLFKLPDYKKLI